MSESKIFDAYSRYYDLLYVDKRYQAEADYVYNRLLSLNPRLESILEFGCGTGKHARILADKGLRVSGIERSAEMLEPALLLARQTPTFSVMEGDVRNACLNGKFDAVISLFHVISYQISNDDVLSTFRNAANHLLIGGIFFFDIWFTPAVLFQRPTVRIKKLTDSNTTVTRIAEPRLLPEQNAVQVNYTVFIEDNKSQQISTLHEQRIMRHFSLPEIEMLAGIAGFEIISSEEFLTGKPPSENSWGVAFSLRKERIM